MGLVAQTKPPVIPHKDFKGATAYRVTEVTDGDTITVDIDGKPVKVRLLGVDAPELGREHGAESHNAVAHLLQGESVYLESDKPDQKDLYSRKLAYVYRAPDGLFVNLEIVRQGYGKVYTKEKCGQQELLTYYESVAKEAKKGVWGSDGAAQAPPVAVPPKAQPAKEQPRVGPEEKKEQQPEQDVTVYVTKTGQKYHRAGCSYLRKSSIPMKLSDAKRSYGPCSRCNPP